MCNRLLGYELINYSKIMHAKIVYKKCLKAGKIELAEKIYQKYLK